MIKLSIRDNHHIWLYVHSTMDTATKDLAKGTAYALKAVSAHSGQPLKSLTADLILQVIALTEDDGDKKPPP